MNEWSSRSNCGIAECFPEKSTWRWNEQVCQGVKCKVKGFEQSKGLDTGYIGAYIGTTRRLSVVCGECVVSNDKEAKCSVWRVCSE